jgi:alpha-ribazole phosphatase
METRWWWIRHAPVPDGGRIYGQRDLDCDCSARRVFEALAAELPKDAIWLTSNLARTHQTAAAIRAAMPGEVIPAPRAVAALAEQHLGDWQGLDRQTFLSSRRSDTNPFWFGPANERAPNGESFDDLVGRVRGAVDELGRELAGRDVIAVTHGGTIRAALSLALKLDADAALGCVIDNCSLTRLDQLRSGRWRVRCVNHRPWLGALI